MVSGLFYVNVYYSTPRKVEDIVNQWLLLINCLLGAVHLFTVIGALHPLFHSTKLYNAF